MGYVLLMLATLSWSFVGILVKAASAAVDSTTITLARFAFGVLFLGLFLFIRDRSLQLRFDMKWIWIGAIGKCMNYFFENIAISIGYSYGNILVGPVQTVSLLLLSVVLLKDKVTPRGWFAAAMCVAGVLIISWNGVPLAELFSGGALTTLLFVISGIGATFHVLSQKLLIRDLDSGTMNFSIFFWASLVMLLPLPWQFEIKGAMTWTAWLALMLLGLITGLSFYWFSQALKKVAFPIAVIVSNTAVLFTILWGYLFYGDPVTTYIIGGAVLFTVGLVVLNLPSKRVRLQAAAEQGSIKL
ncbi:DMT family transporter [Paenibacillus sp. GD4]|uniref:DMT family transporter n=1 Tax=Paenibacillus sp. GD4 TaxID=3068890 RepID=UPI0027968247|nr:DMT family transporter [Paenibacillus sp. GD4]MDQ1911038.1 DMT family transporter [Paenibacillus sp. GD4]